MKTTHDEDEFANAREQAMLRSGLRHLDAKYDSLWRYLCARVIDGDAAREKLEDRVKKLEALASNPAAKKPKKE